MTQQPPVSERFTLLQKKSGSSDLAGLELSGPGWLLPRSAGAGPPYSASLVVGVAEAEGDAADVFDDAVIAFAAGI